MDSKLFLGRPKQSPPLSSWPDLGHVSQLYPMQRCLGKRVFGQEKKFHYWLKQWFIPQDWAHYYSEWNQDAVHTEKGEIGHSVGNHISQSYKIWHLLLLLLTSLASIFTLTFSFQMCPLMYSYFFHRHLERGTKGPVKQCLSLNDHRKWDRRHEKEQTQTW